MKLKGPISIRWKIQLVFMLVVIGVSLIQEYISLNNLEIQFAVAQSASAPQVVLQSLSIEIENFWVTAFWQLSLILLVVFIVILPISNIVLRPLSRLADAVKTLEGKNLTANVEITAFDEIGRLQNRFNRMVKQLSRVMTKLDNNSLLIGQSAYQISQASYEIELSAESEEERAREVDQASKELEQAFQQVRMLSESTADQSKLVRERAETGRKELQLSIDQMLTMSNSIEDASTQVTDLSAAANEITTILAELRSISDQTNLLALNAAIEAARAGEHGRGFAVVADEVRELAKRAQGSAGEVEGIIDDLTQKVESVVKIMSHLVEQVAVNREQVAKTDELIQSMVDNAAETERNSALIDEACVVQANSNEQLSTALNKLFETQQDNGIKISNTANISSSMLELTEYLGRVLAELKFTRISSEEPGDEFQKIRKAKRVRSQQLATFTHEGISVEGVVKDISLGGLSVATKKPLLEKEFYDVSMKLPSSNLEAYQKQKPLSLRAQVMRIEALDRYHSNGVRLVDVTDEQKKKLSECIDFFN